MIYCHVKKSEENLLSCINVILDVDANFFLFLKRLFAHADDPDIDEPFKPSVGQTLGQQETADNRVTYSRTYH